MRNNPIALYAIVLSVSIIVDTTLGLFFDYSMFDFWTQFFAGTIIIGIGLALGYWVMHVLETNGVELAFGEKPRILIQTGPYAISRNPLYVAMTVIYVGATVLFDSPIAILVLAPLLYHMKKRIIPAEEALLAEAFGVEYETYKSKVKCWL